MGLRRRQIKMILHGFETFFTDVAHMRNRNHSFRTQSGIGNDHKQASVIYFFLGGVFSSFYGEVALWFLVVFSITNHFKYVDFRFVV